jgi:hypothetical protein
MIIHEEITDHMREASSTVAWNLYHPLMTWRKSSWIPLLENTFTALRPPPTASVLYSGLLYSITCLLVSPRLPDSDHDSAVTAAAPSITKGKAGSLTLRYNIMEDAEGGKDKLMSYESLCNKESFPFTEEFEQNSDQNTSGSIRGNILLTMRTS